MYFVEIIARETRVRPLRWSGPSPVALTQELESTNIFRCTKHIFEPIHYVYNVYSPIVATTFANGSLFASVLAKSSNRSLCIEAAR